MDSRIAIVVMSLVFVVAPICYGQGLWHPQSPGTAMTEHLYNVDGTHREAVWANHAGFEMSVDSAATYDNWRTVDSAPQIRIDLTATSVNLRNEDFVITARTNLRTGYGDRFHAGLCVVFSANDVMVWGPHGATDLRFRRPDGVDISQAFPNNAAFLKIKRHGNEYSAWYSEDGKNWTLSGSTTISAAPIAVGTILKTWSVAHAETVDFDYFELTNVQNEPTSYLPNTRYGNTDPAAPIFKYELSGAEILLRIFINDDGTAPDPEDTKYYLIHATTRPKTNPCYTAILNYDWIVTKLAAGGYPNLVLVAPRFLRNPCYPHPYGYSWSYQDLKAEEDWILMDIHENFTRMRFPAATPGNDERFFLSGHSGGGQFVSRFIMGHSDKVIRAVASSPWGTAYPTSEYEWIYGTYLPSDFRQSNPRFSIDLDGARASPLAVVMGEHDTELDRGWAQIAVLSRRRLDNAMKWVRQMNSDSIDLFIVPEAAHTLNQPDKLNLLLAYLFGDPGTFSPWLHSSPEPDFQDTEQWDVFPFEIPEEQLFYFQFDRFPRDVRRIGVADRRYTIYPAGLCAEETIATSSFASVPCTVTHTAGNLYLTIEGSGGTRTYGGIWANLLYGKLRLYTTDVADTYMLEESSSPTFRFIDDEVVGRRFHIYECTGRGADGPECGPFPVETIQLNSDRTVTNPDTGLPPNYENIREWWFDSTRTLITFKDDLGAFASLQIGDWRWGEDASGQPFVAGMHTRDQTGNIRREIQTNTIYNPRYFEDWDVDRLDYDGDKVTDIVDNCPVTVNGSQTDTDQDGLGDACDAAAPSSVLASDGTFIERVVVSWTTSPGATHHKVYRNSTNNPLTSTAISSWQTAKSFSDGAVVPGTDYYYWVRATAYPNGNTESGFSGGNSGWAALAAPDKVMASDGSVFDQVFIIWETVPGAASYSVLGGSSSDSNKAVPLSGWQGQNEFVDTDLLSNTTRYYWVQASPYVSGGRNSALSESNSGWFQTSAIFDDDFETGNISEWSSSQP